MRKTWSVLGAALLAALISLGGASQAGATIHHHLAGGNYTFQEANGSYYIGFLDSGAGNPVVEQPNSPRLWTFTPVTTYKGRNAGYVQNTAGNFLAATNNCDTATIKSSADSFGVIWVPKSSGGINVNIVNRGCDNNAGSKDTVFIGGPNTQSIFQICDSAGGGCHGLFTQMTPG